jgi:hypothetical protein
MPSLTREVFIQRGNYPTMAVQWLGEVDDNLADFLLSRGIDEYFVSSNRAKVLILRKGLRFEVVNHGVWLVDQGPPPEGYADIYPWGFVLCDEERFKRLYHEVPPEEHEGYATYASGGVMKLVPVKRVRELVDLFDTCDPEAIDYKEFYNKVRDLVNA